MSITLQKGNTLNLSKKEPSLKKAMLGLGWEVKIGNPLDLDASVFMLGRNGKIPADEYFVFYNNLRSPDGAVQHTGDNRSGIGDGDDEAILLNLPMIDKQIMEIVVVVTIHEAQEHRHNFGLLHEAYIRLVDVESSKEVLTYDLDEQYPNSTAVELGRLQRVENEWVFKATGIGSSAGLQGYVDMYA